MTPSIALQFLGLATLLPLLPFVLEMQALRRMSVSAFGTLTATEPATAALLGLFVLGQVPGPLQITGMVLVVLAGIGAQRQASVHTITSLPGGAA